MEILEENKEKLETKTDKCQCQCKCEDKICYFQPPIDNTSDFWLLGLLTLLLFSDASKNESKQPIINIYTGGDK